MSQGTRPGGLTALAWINFVLAANAAMGTLYIVSLLTVPLKHLETNAQTLKLAETLRDNLVHSGILIGLTLVAGVLLLLSGLGYLAMKRFKGRVLGSAYACVDLITLVVGLTLLPFGIQHMVSVIYPAITLILLNTTFKDDLVN